MPNKRVVFDLLCAQLYIFNLMKAEQMCCCLSCTNAIIDSIVLKISPEGSVFTTRCYA